MTDTPPDWVLIEAAKRCGRDLTSLSVITDLYATDAALRALCDMILKHEQPPVDRKALCAKEAQRNVTDRNLDEDWWEAIAIRAIELWEEGFGK